MNRPFPLGDKQIHLPSRGGKMRMKLLLCYAIYDACNRLHAENSVKKICVSRKRERKQKTKQQKTLFVLHVYLNGARYLAVHLRN